MIQVAMNPAVPEPGGGDANDPGRAPAGVCASAAGALLLPAMPRTIAEYGRAVHVRKERSIAPLFLTPF